MLRANKVIQYGVLFISGGLASSLTMAQGVQAPAVQTQGIKTPDVQTPPNAALSEMKAAIEKAEQQAQGLDKAKKDAAAKDAEGLRALRSKIPKTSEERAAFQAARAKFKQQQLVEADPVVRAANEKEQQARNAHIAAINSVKAAHAKAEGASQLAAKLDKDLQDIKKPNPARGANFNPQNVMPLTQGIDSMTKRLSAVKTSKDLAGPQVTQIDQELEKLKKYMDRVDEAMLGVHRAGVQTPANKEAEAIYLQVGEKAKALELEMQRIEKLYTTQAPIHAVFAKFRD